MQRRSPDGVLLLTDMDDVDWDRPPPTPQDAFQEASVLNNDFDELAGTFSQSSVSSNRQLNETVGGMRLLSGAANAVTEFDLRVWVETWVEPVLWQVLKLEEFYEDDAKVLALAGNKAGLVQKSASTLSPTSFSWTTSPSRISVGVGASDPMQGLEKFATAGKIVGDILLPFITAGKIDVTPNTKEIVDEVFGKAGFKNAGERFFTVLSDQPPGPPPGSEGPPQPDPVAIAKIEADQASKAADRDAKVGIARATLADKAEDRRSKTLLATMKAQADMAKARMNEVGTDRRLAFGHAHTRAEGTRTKLLDALLAAQAAPAAGREGAAARG